MATPNDLAALWSDDEISAPRALDVFTQIAHFLDQTGYANTFAALCKEARTHGLTIDIAEWERGIEGKTSTPLLDLYEEWHNGNDKFPTLPSSEAAEEDTSAGSSSSSSSSDSDESASDAGSKRDAAEGVLVDVEAEETSDDDSDERSGSGSEDASDSSSEGSDTSSASPVKPGMKRKRVLTPPSASDSDSSADDASSESGSSDDSSSSDDSDSRPAKRAKVPDATRASEGNESNPSSSDSDSSDSSSESEEDPKSVPPPPRPVGKKKDETTKRVPSLAISAETKDSGSLSSATLEADSAPEQKDDSGGAGQIHPDRLKRMPTTKKEVATMRKKALIPFSRIPTDQDVDPRFSSNEYVSYDYADRAYRDLVVTKGKGFTKEKNKKKRGSYRGGMIDLTPKGIKFDD